MAKLRFSTSLKDYSDFRTQCKLTFDTTFATNSDAFEIVRINRTPKNSILKKKLRSCCICASEMNLPIIPEGKLARVVINGHTIRS